MRHKKLLPYYILAFALVFLSARSAYALTITPIRIELKSNPGTTVEANVTITNEQKASANFYPSFANFEAQGESGNPTFSDDSHDLASWMSTDQLVHLEPNESKTVKIKISIPSDADPGGHFAAAFFGTLPPNKSGNGQIGIGAKTGTLILLSVNGDVKESAGLLDFYPLDHKTFYNTLPVSFSYRFRNDGGDRIKPAGSITMHDIFYIPEDSIDANPSSGNILPNSTRRFGVDWIKSPRDKEYTEPTGVFAKFFGTALYEWHNYAFGPYFVKLNLLYGTSATRVSKMAFIFVFPWQLLICLAIILIIIFWGGKKLIRRYNRHIIQKARVGMNTPSDVPHA